MRQGAIVITPHKILHHYVGIETVTDIIAKFAKSHEKRLQDHINIEVPDFSTRTISPDDLNGRNRLNWLNVRTLSDSMEVS
jgi:hypothetical protein